MTRMLIVYLQAAGKDSKLDYGAILSGTGTDAYLSEPKTYLLDANHWVPHAVLQRLMAATESITGEPDAAYHAACRYFLSNATPSLLELLAFHVNDVGAMLLHAGIWAPAYTSYLKLQCVALSDSPPLSRATFFAQYDKGVTLRHGNIGLVRGCCEGLPKLFRQVTDVQCTETFTQLSLEQLMAEFENYHLEADENPKWKNCLFITETASKRRVAIAKRTGLTRLSLPYMPQIAYEPDELICKPEEGQICFLTAQTSDDPSGFQVYQIIQPGLIQQGNVTYPLQSGQIFNAPYSSFEITWNVSPPETSDPSRPAHERPNIISSFLRHMRETRQTSMRLVHCLVENAKVTTTNQALEVRLENLTGVSGMIARSPLMRATLDRVSVLAPIDVTILLTGPTGVGKEALAREIHQQSLRKDRMFYAINCAALTDTLIAAELFGYEKGAFTDAKVSRPGIFETAVGGTVFLDEIGECSPDLQAKLLRVLEAKEIQRIGGRQTLPVDIRILAATNRDLAAEITKGTFREDLFYRLNIVTIYIAPLCERTEDISPLVEHFLRLFSAKYNKQVSLVPEALPILMARPWPGNVRELKNTIERAVIFCKDREMTPAHLEVPLPREDPLPVAPLPPKVVDFYKEVAQHRRALIAEALRRMGGNQTLAAQALGLQRSYLARLIKQMKI